MNCPTSRILRRLTAGILVLVSLLLSQAVFGQDDGVNEAAVWIDVRSPREYREGHIEGAINIPHADIAHRIGDFVTDTYQPLHLYGSSTAFTGLALEILMEMGFQYVVNEGSYEAVLERRREQ
jgi:phage shock protein E